MPADFDALIIGAGQAGPPLAGRLTQAGMRVALVEREYVGGTCVNTGCIPTKTLVASARVAHVARHAGRWGIETTGPVQVDMKAVKARKDRVALESRAGVERWLSGMSGLTLFHGHARFEGNKNVRVGDDRLRAERIFINVGARPRYPAFASGLKVWTNTEMMDVDFLPPHLVVVGGGAIGLEFAQMFRRFGSEVTLVEMQKRLVPREDDEVCTVVRSILQEEGIGLRLGAECVNIEEDGQGFRLNVACEEGPPTVEGSHVLLAVGRVPNTDDLGLETTDIKTDDRGFVVVDSQLRTGVDGVWALGEVNRRGAFTHTSYNDFEIVAENLLDGAHRSVDDRFLCYAVFMDPPLARVGLSLTQAQAMGKPILTALRPMSRVGRARERSETTGFMRIVMDAESRLLLGATLVGVEADEAIHTVAAMMYAGGTAETLRRSVHIHPTVAELLPTLAGALKPADVGSAG